MTASRAAAATSADICIDYDITTINAIVLNSSGDTVTSVSWPCLAHEGTITGVPVGSNYIVRLNGIDSNNSITWRGEKSGIDIISEATAVAGTITMTYIGSDTTAPVVTSVNPTMSLYYLAGVPVTTSLTATFSEKMALSSINISTFTVSNGSTSVSGSVTYDPDTMKATFIPSGSLSYSTTYTATITTDVEDMAGNRMQANYSWSFITEASPWSITTIDSIGNAKAGISISIDSNNKIHISYVDDTNGDLKYATNISGSWVTATIDDSTGRVGFSPSIAIDSNNKIHISYHDETQSYLKYATNTSGSWVISSIDSGGDYTSLAVDSNAKVHISYSDVTTHGLQYATNVSGTWATSTIDSTGTVGEYHSIAIDSNNKVHIGYSRNDYPNGALKYATNL